MKCICGYEQKGDFDFVSHAVQVDPTRQIYQNVMMPNLFYCPICGTVKTKTKKEKENEITDKSI